MYKWQHKTVVVIGHHMNSTYSCSLDMELLVHEVTSTCRFFTVSSKMSPAQWIPGGQLSEDMVMSSWAVSVDVSQNCFYSELTGNFPDWVFFFFNFNLCSFLKHGHWKVEFTWGVKDTILFHWDCSETTWILSWNWMGATDWMLVSPIQMLNATAEVMLWASEVCGRGWGSEGGALMLGLMPHRQKPEMPSPFSPHKGTGRKLSLQSKCSPILSTPGSGLSAFRRVTT